jgi:hypothetical protein
MSFDAPEIPRDDFFPQSKLAEQAVHEEQRASEANPTSDHPGLFDDIHTEAKSMFPACPSLCDAPRRDVRAQHVLWRPARHVP